MSMIMKTKIGKMTEPDDHPQKVLDMAKTTMAFYKSY